jgi:DNA repair protein RecO
MTDITLEGIVIKKVVVKDHDLLVVILNRQGNICDIYCYGGQSSRRGKSSLLEIGMMNRYSVSLRRNGSYVLKSAESIWSYKGIRFNYSLFSALAFICELASVLAIKTDEQEQNRGLFNIFSNAIFYLDRMEERNVPGLLVLLVVKLIRFMGIMIDCENCVYSEKTLTAEDDLILNFSLGGFGISKFYSDGVQGESDRQLWKIVKVCSHTSFKQLPLQFDISIGHLNKLSQFLFFQLNISLEQFNSLRLLNQALGKYLSKN